MSNFQEAQDLARPGLNISGMRCVNFAPTIPVPVSVGGGHWDEGIAPLEGIHAIRCVHALIDELTEKLFDIRHEMASFPAGLWLDAQQEFHSQLAGAEGYIQETICGKADELLASGFTAEATCLSERVWVLCDLLTDTQDMANNYELPGALITTVMQPLTKTAVAHVELHWRAVKF